jgi:hypothetical protein
LVSDELEYSGEGEMIGYAHKQTLVGIVTFAYRFGVGFFLMIGIYTAF